MQTKQRAAPSQNLRRCSALVLFNVFEQLLIDCACGAFISAVQDDDSVVCFEDDDGVTAGVGVTGIAAVEIVLKFAHGKSKISEAVGANVAAIR